MKSSVRYLFLVTLVLFATLQLIGYWNTDERNSLVFISARPLLGNKTKNECHSSCEAVVTLITDESYLLPALVLGYTLKNHGATIGRDVLAIMPSGTINDARHLSMLTQIGWTIIVGKRTSFPGKVIPRLKDGLVKLHAWNLIQYRIVATLDADIMLTGSIDEPFQHLRQHPFTEMLGVNDPYLTNSASFIHWKGQYFNSGVLFFRPSADHYLQLVQHSSNTSYYDLQYPQQNLLNTYYRNHWQEISPIFNFPDYLHVTDALRNKYPEISRRIIHFAGDIKPWYSDPNETKQSVRITEATTTWRRTAIEMMVEYGWTKYDFGISRTFLDLCRDPHFQKLLNATARLIHGEVCK